MGTPDSHVKYRVYQAAEQDTGAEVELVDLRQVFADIGTEVEECHGIYDLPVTGDEVDAIAVEAVRQGTKQVEGKKEDMLVSARFDIFPKNVEEWGEQEQSYPHLDIPAVGNGGEVGDFQNPLHPGVAGVMEAVYADEDGYCRDDKIGDNDAESVLVVLAIYPLVEVEVAGKH